MEDSIRIAREARLRGDGGKAESKGVLSGVSQPGGVDTAWSGGRDMALLSEQTQTSDSHAPSLECGLQPQADLHLLP